MTQQASETGARGQTVTIVRSFDAPIEAVWEMWTKPENFSAWFSTPPYRTPLATVSLDVRPGGTWRATQVSDADGSELPFAGIYREVVEPESLVFTFEDPENPANSDVELATVVLRDVGGKTEMTFRQEGHLPEEQYPLLLQGYTRFFDQMQQLLEHR